MKLWTAIPNFVDCSVFAPVNCAFRQRRTCLRQARFPPEADLPPAGTLSARGGPASGRPASRIPHPASRLCLGIPADAFVIGTVAAVKKYHKRIDYLIREFALFLERQKRMSLQEEREDRQEMTAKGRRKEPSRSSRPSCEDAVLSSARDTVAVPYLLIAGAGTDESDELIKTAEKLAPGRVKILLDLPRDQMPDFYRSLDVFVLTSLFEMMPIALLEAMASGVPVVLNDHPVLRWIVGDENGLAQSSQRTPRKENTGQIPELSESGRNFSPGLRREIEMKEQTLQQSFQHAAGQATDNGRLTTNDASAGACIDMSKEGELARFLNGITPAWIEEHGRNARERVERMFSKEAVIPQILEMYAAVAEEDADRKKY